jgi:hypothetical protein
MSAELVSAAKAEEQRLLRELEATSLYRRLEAVRALLSEYQGDAAVTPAQPSRTRHSATRQGSLTSRVIEIAQDHLRQVQRRAQSLEILRVAQDRGIEFKGNKPTTVVASILSHCDLFDNVRGEGYGLAEWAAASVSPDDGTGQQSGAVPTAAPSQDDKLDTDPTSAVHNNGATSDERSWPQFGS